MSAPRPAWLDRVLAAVEADEPEAFSTFAPPADAPRQSAVLMLFGPTADAGSLGAAELGGTEVSGTEVSGKEASGTEVSGTEVSGTDVILTARSRELRAHPGQVSFPGGRVDPTDAGPVAAALREAEEEVGVVPSSVEVVGSLPRLFLTPSANAVTPVVGWWPVPGEVRVVDPGEVERVERVRLEELLDPNRRFTVAHPSGYRGPGFEAGGLFVWGFTAMLLNAVFDLAGLTQPWDPGRERPIPETVLTDWMRNRG